MAKQTVKISCEEMVTMVTKEFITGQEPAFLRKVEKAAKGGGMLNDMGDVLTNKSKTFSLCVLKPLFFFMKSKDVILSDKVQKIDYEMDPKKDWPKFYEGIVNAIAKENRK